MPGPTSDDKVRAHLGAAVGDIDGEAIPAAVVAVNDWIASWRSPEDGEWPPRVVLGATMLAARYVRRRNSPSGVEAFGEMGATYVNRWDHDIAMMLGLGRHSRLAVG